ncbi:PREDICTED: uncharacterized protein LOC104769009 [Camelina sativa]|uniref:Uncharacterized protein LOC104769009 n=1 Tax=Camelina sativa TaxID=90675 RepID=A0ABM0XV22_CAMSA|nr:PREDICTED: uncharacterized protein LOC104769009 [Camelina sativa]
MVVETRSQLTRAEEVIETGRSEVPLTEVALGTQITQVFERLEVAIAEQNKKLEDNIVDMFEMVKIRTGQQSSPHGKQICDGSEPVKSASPERLVVSSSRCRGEGSVNRNRSDGSGYRNSGDDSGFQHQGDGFGYQNKGDGSGYQNRGEGYGYQNRGDGYGYQNRGEERGYQNHYAGVTRVGKVDYPRFNGEWISEWILKVEDFFSLDFTPGDFKVKMAAIHFDGDAADWHQSLMHSPLGRNVLRDWQAYKLLLQERFEDVLDDPIAELKQLQETNGIVEYLHRFELIRNRLSLSEEYLMRAYLAGLRLDTQMHIRMFQPQSVRQCLVLGRLYEKAHPHQKGSSGGWSSAKSNSTSLTVKNQGVVKQTNQASGGNTGFQSPKNRKFLSQEEMSERRAKGLCFICDEKYTPEHYLKHKKTQVFMIEVEEEVGEQEYFEEQYETEDEKDMPRVSISVVSGVADYRTIKVRGTHGKKVLFILLDTGSTHNFINPSTAKALGVTVQSAGVARVAVADGSKLGVQGKVSQFKWSFQGTAFKDDFMLIPLGGCDMVLGVQWLAPLGDTTWNFQKLEMGFWWNKQRILLHGIKQGAVRTLKAAKFNKAQEEAVQISMICAQAVEPQEDMMLCAVEDNHNENVSNAAVLELKESFADIFAEPTELPPFRENHNHKIVLKEGADPINQRPYRYAVYQKDEIDKIVKDLLAAGTIRMSSSPFSSPVVLVKKKDGTWRLCVDYRGLNGLTIKNSFPIPLIEDLMDELGGSAVFSKIDLRAGYHQVRMEPADIQKTAFKTHGGHFEYLVMPFGLTNAPATFQGLMNSVFKEFLRKFVLIFFDDILVYSSSMTDHIVHLQKVFNTMREHKLFAKESKCEFATAQVEYLGHYIAAGGVSTDPTKVNAVADWPLPSNLKQLRGFLGLAGYYRRFVKNFGTIARPLTLLTKKDAFTWSVEASEAFTALKQALCEAPVLAFPRFDKPFLVETDACTKGIGAVLMQEGHPLAFISRHLKGKQLNLSIYEKELLAVVFAVQKWRHYLLPNHFIIRTDQRSLKYLLEQRLNTPIQQQWLPKLLEFDYEIQYRQGKDNIAADALSRVEGAEVLHMAMSVLECDLLKDIQAHYATDAELKKLIDDLAANIPAKKHYTWTQSILRRKTKIVVPNNIQLRDSILQWMHCSGTGGHLGRDATYQKVKGLFYWKGMAVDIQKYIRSCAVCQQCKYDTSAYPGLLQPLPIPETIWTDLSMDFIDGLPDSAGKTVIFVVVDRLTKAAHFMALAHPYSAVTVAQAFMDTVFKLHGCPRSIVSDRDTIFVSTFWRELFTLQGVDLKFSSAYHPQSDGQTEVVNRCLETYLRCMCSDKPHLWSSWLPLAEFWYNTNFHTATQMSPFEAVYGQSPPVHLPYLPGESKVAVVARSLQERESMLLILKFHLLRAQHRMKQFADSHRTDRSFEIGDSVFVKHQPYRQGSVVVRSNQKLSPKYFGPYKIVDRCGKVAYKLLLPGGSQIHPVFHVSQLKAVVGQVLTSTQLPSIVVDVLVKAPVSILDRKMVKRQGRAVTMVLVQWTNETAEEATWEYLYDLQRKFPAFEPCGQGSPDRGVVI